MYIHPVKGKIVKLGNRKFVQIPKLHNADFEVGQLIFILTEEGLKKIEND